MHKRDGRDIYSSSCFTASYFRIKYCKTWGNPKKKYKNKSTKVMTLFSENSQWDWAISFIAKYGEAMGKSVSSQFCYLWATRKVPGKRAYFPPPIRNAWQWLKTALPSCTISAKWKSCCYPTVELMTCTPLVYGAPSILQWKLTARQIRHYRLPNPILVTTGWMLPRNTLLKC